MIRRFARPYARAVFDVAGSPEKANEIRSGLAQFEQIRKSAPDLQELYANPAIDLEAKLAVTRQLANRLGLSEIVLKVLEVLIRNRRINDLAAIEEALATYVNQALDVAVVDVSSAHDLNTAEKTELRSTLEQKVGKKIDLRLRTDPALLGGFVARIGSEIWDASVAGKIHKFRESLT